MLNSYKKSKIYGAGKLKSNCSLLYLICNEEKKLQQTDDDNMGNIDLNDVIHYALSTFKGGMIHGITHWENVERNGLLMAEENPEINGFLPICTTISGIMTELINPMDLGRQMLCLIFQALCSVICQKTNLKCCTKPARCILHRLSLLETRLLTAA